ncbi:MAG: hypothetical protein AAGA56_13125, partial [Myxococcota bacterium]
SLGFAKLILPPKTAMPLVDAPLALEVEPPPKPAPLTESIPAGFEPTEDDGVGRRIKTKRPQPLLGESRTYPLKLTVAPPAPLTVAADEHPHLTDGARRPLADGRGKSGYLVGPGFVGRVAFGDLHQRFFNDQQSGYIQTESYDQTGPGALFFARSAFARLRFYRSTALSPKPDGTFEFLRVQGEVDRYTAQITRVDLRQRARAHDLTGDGLFYGFALTTKRGPRLFLIGPDLEARHRSEGVSIERQNDHPALENYFTVVEVPYAKSSAASFEADLLFNADTWKEIAPPLRTEPCETRCQTGLDLRRRNRQRLLFSVRRDADGTGHLTIGAFGSS